MRHCLPIVLCLAFAAAPARAQAPAHVLQAPSRSQAPAAPAATPSSHPPTPAPRAVVRQVAPMASPSLLGKSTPGKQTPVVHPPANVHAQKPPPAAAKPGVKPAAPSAGVAAGAGAVAAKPATPPPPVVPDKPVEPSIGPSGAPLPRWASLRSDEVNLRSGPGTRYPVQWVYRRRDLPVEIQREYEAWRLIGDQDGVKGWVHSATLVGRRSFAVTGKDRVLRKSPADDAAPVAVLKLGVVGRIRSCEAGQAWCEMQVGGYRGFLKRDEFFGASVGETVK